MNSSTFFNINNTIGETFIGITNSSSATTFDPTINLYSGKDSRIDFGDGVAQARSGGAPYSYTYADSGDNKTFIMSTDKMANVNTLNFSNDGLVGDIDLSPFTECLGFTFNGNTSLTGVTLPTTDTAVSTLNFFLCDLHGELDLASNIPNFAGTVFTAFNSSLTGITIPVSGANNINTFRSEGCDLHGRFDFSGFTNFGGYLDIGQNPNVTGLTLPSNSKTYTRFDIGSTGIVGHLELSGLTGLGGYFDIDSCVGITSISFPNSSNSFTNFLCSNTLTSEFDFSPLSGFGGFVSFQSCPLLTGVTFPPSTTTSTSIAGNNSTAITSVDFSPMSGLQGNLGFDGCTSLSAITFPHVCGLFTTISFDTCGIDSYVNMNPLTATTQHDIDISFNANAITSKAHVNRMLVDLDNFGWTGGTFNIAGGTSAGPDGSSGGYDGVTAANNLVVKGWTVSTN